MNSDHSTNQSHEMEYDELSEEVRQKLHCEIDAACSDFTLNIGKRGHKAINKIAESEKAKILEKMRCLRQRYGHRVVNAALRDAALRNQASVWVSPDIRWRKSTIQAMEKEAHAARPQFVAAASWTETIN